MAPGSVVIVITPQTKVPISLNTLSLVIAPPQDILVQFVLNFVLQEMLWEVTMLVFTEYNYFVLAHEDVVMSKMYKTQDGWNCSDCDYKSKNNSNVYEHIEAKHVLGPGYVCQYCVSGKVLSTRKALRCHMYTYHPKLK